MATLRQAHARHALVYHSIAQSNSHNLDLLDQEFPQIQIAIGWLMQQSDMDQVQFLPSFVSALSYYLQRRGFNPDLLKYTERALQVAAQLGTNAGWLWLLKYEALWALGEWENSLAAVQEAIRTTDNADAQTYARAVLALGRLQLNRGQYRDALRTLAKAQELLTSVQDYDGVAAAKAEVAAYHLNRSENKKALNLYQEVDRLRRQVNPDVPSQHSLLMLGVVHRRLRDYQKAIESLSELIHGAEEQKDRGAMATGKHHLAWIYYDRREWKEARKLGQEARQIYEELGDPRGSSDADEQLGLICLAERDLVAAGFFLERSLSIREELGNQHGVASSFRRLAKLHLSQWHIRLGLRYLVRSLSMYYQLGVLTYRRFFNILGELLR